MLIAFCLHLFTTSYVKDAVPHFTNITNANNLTLNLSIYLDYKLEQEKKIEEQWYIGH